jgi:hypothetical protein
MHMSSDNNKISNNLEFKIIFHTILYFYLWQEFHHQPNKKSLSINARFQINCRYLPVQAANNYFGFTEPKNTLTQKLLTLVKV